MKPTNPRGLIVTGALVPGIMRGEVTVTSRIIKQANDHGEPAGAVHPARESGWIAWWPGAEAGLAEFTKREYLHGFPCPFRVGEIRYVKEAWRPWGWREDGPIIIEYADGARVAETGSDEDASGYEDWYSAVAESATLECERKGVALDSEGCYHWQGENPLAWRSPLFLPRYCARTWIEILSVKPARCQEITEEEAIASGVFGPPQSQAGWREYPYESCHLATAIDSYRTLWDSLNARRGFPWSASPWCWRIAFRRTEAPC